MNQTPLAVNDVWTEGFPLLTYALESALSSGRGGRLFGVRRLAAALLPMALDRGKAEASRHTPKRRSVESQPTDSAVLTIQSPRLYNRLQ
jgi:hypothetical protein